MPGSKNLPWVEFDSPLVNELYELAEAVLIPKIHDLRGFPGSMIKGFIVPLLPQLPQAFSVLDRDPDLQRQIMAQLEERYHRLRPRMAEYFRQAQQINDPDFIEGHPRQSRPDRIEDDPRSRFDRDAGLRPRHSRGRGHQAGPKEAS